MTTLQDVVRQIESSRAGLSTFAAIMNAASIRNPALEALDRNRAAIARLAQSQSDMISKIVTDYNAGMAIASPAIKQLTTQAESLSRIARAARPDPAVLEVLRQSQLRVVRTAELFNKNAALLAAQKLQVSAVRLIDALPNIRAIAARVQRDSEGHAVLDEAGFELIYHLAGGAFAAELATVSPQVRGAVVTNKLLHLTKSEDFEATLSDVFRETPILQRRWPIMSQALQAHRRREYWVAIPALMSQLEGLIGDALVLKSTAKKVRGKFYDLDKNGSVRLNKFAKPIELRGLVGKITKFNLADHELVQGVVDLLNAELATRRNLILHGSDVRYGTAKLSTQLLLSAYLWALEIAAFVS